MVWERFPMLVRSGANVTSENPERNDALRLEDGEQSDVRKPERNGILRLDEMMSREARSDRYLSIAKLLLMNFVYSYSLSFILFTIRYVSAEKAKETKLVCCVIVRFIVWRHPR